MELEVVVIRGIYDYNGSWVRRPTYSEYDAMDIRADGQMSSMEITTLDDYLENNK